MPHGGPDWGTAGPLATVYTIEDIGELAARLGSIVTFDRRGNVTFLEDFSGNLAKLYTWEGAPAHPSTIIISSEKAISGSFSCKVTTDVYENDGLNIFVALPYPILGKMGVEQCWRRDDNLKILYLGLGLNDGATDYFGYVRWNYATGVWEYQTTGGAWVALTPTATYRNTLFNHTKVVVDFVNKEYCRLIANERTYDLTDLAVHSWPRVTSPHMWTQFKATNSNLGNNCVMHLDNIIVTQNEP